MGIVKRGSVYPLLSIISFAAFAYHLWLTHERAATTTPPDTQPAVVRDESIHKQEVIHDPDIFKNETTHSNETIIEVPAKILSQTHTPSPYDDQIRNSTLGFEKVFVLSLPSRGDRLDAFVLSASLTGFEAELAKGVLGDTVPDSSLPSTKDLTKDKKVRNAVVGTWRAHLNIARTIVQRGLSSALIIEDDSDWDVTLKDQLVTFAEGTRHFSKDSSTGDKQLNSPYGDSWDMIWPGHCGTNEAKFPPSTERFVIENDGTVPHPKHRVNFVQTPNVTEYDSTTRTVFEAGDGGCCLYGYALSYAGAQKVLRAQAIRKSWVPIDLGMGAMCGDQENPFHCIAVFPQLIDSHKMAGTLDRDSNIGDFSHTDVRKTAYTYNIVNSTRLNVDRLLTGQTPLSQWPGDKPPILKPGGPKTRIQTVKWIEEKAHKDKDPKKSSDAKESKQSSESKEAKENKDSKESKENKDSKPPTESPDSKPKTPDESNNDPKKPNEDSTNKPEDDKPAPDSAPPPATPPPPPSEQASPPEPSFEKDSIVAAAANEPATEAAADEVNTPK